MNKLLIGAVIFVQQLAVYTMEQSPNLTELGTQTAFSNEQGGLGCVNICHKI